MTCDSPPRLIERRCRATAIAAQSEVTRDDASSRKPLTEYHGPTPRAGEELGAEALVDVGVHPQLQATAHARPGIERACTSDDNE